jgi:hypothetical protein
MRESEVGNCVGRPYRITFTFRIFTASYALATPLRAGRAEGGSTMRVRVSCLVGLAAIALVASCDHNPSAPTSSGTSGMGSSPTVNAPPSSSTSSGATTAAIVGGSERPVTMQDACDPDTFNAAVGPGTCVRNGGGLRFDQFITLLQQHGSVGAWRFSPPTTTARVGQTIVAFNRGGEVHTFTEVAAFAGGIVPELNAAIGLTTVAPECTNLAPNDIVPPGGTDREPLTSSGTKKFMCCIHPWMRMEARVTDK